METAFIVLNYNNFEDTKVCVESLLKLSQNSNKIIVVDNASTDDSFVRLKDIFAQEKNVDLIANQENSGFSKGNNIGCRFAIKNYNIDFLCVMNNDTYITDVEFNDKLSAIYTETEFDILAPCVWNVRKNYNQNPFYCPKNISELEREIKNLERGLKILKFGAGFYYLYNKIHKNRVTGKTLSGTACIFSKNYFQKYDEIFMEKTFMYDEEAFLYQRIINDKLKLVYNNEIVIYHSDAKTTRKIHKSKKAQWRFQGEKILQSNKILLNYLSGEK